MGSMGVTPRLKETFFERLEQETGITLPQQQASIRLLRMEQSMAGQMRFAWCLGAIFTGLTLTPSMPTKL